MKSEAIRCFADEKLTITDISWERLFLRLRLKSGCEEPVSLSLASISIKDKDLSVQPGEAFAAALLEEYPLTASSAENGIYEYRINMSIADGSQFVTGGKWYFIARSAASGDSSAPVSLCRVTYELGYRLQYLSHLFPYGSRYAYAVSFAPLCSDSVNIVPVMSSRFYIENPDWDKTYVVSQHRSLRKKLRCLRKKARVSFLQTVYDTHRKTASGSGKNVLLMSETRPYLWGNLKAVNDRLAERGLDREYNISHSFRNAVGKDDSLAGWIRTVKLLAKQDVIFVDDYAPVFGFLKLSDNTRLVQLWHAGIGFKSVGYARFGQTGSPFPAENCHRCYDFAVTGSEQLVDIYSEVFGQPCEKILPLGMARLDSFLNEKIIKEKTDSFYAVHPELEGKRLILFCPTYRGAGQREAYYDYDKLDLQRIYDFCGNEFVWAFKMHPFVKDAPPVPDGFAGRIIDLTAEKDINDLYYVTDIMITDYSSAYYEFSLLRRPILFYTYDREVYEITRGVQNSVLETAPGRVCDSFDELMDALESGDHDIEKTIRFSEAHFGEYDGKASDRVIDSFILNK